MNLLGNFVEIFLDFPFVFDCFGNMRLLPGETTACKVIPTVEGGDSKREREIESETYDKLLQLLYTRQSYL